MDGEHSEQTTFGWFRRHRRPLAALVLAPWWGAALFFGAAIVWFSARSYPAFAAAVALAIVWVVIRVRRNRRRACRSDQHQSGVLELPEV